MKTIDIIKGNYNLRKTHLKVIRFVNFYFHRFKWPRELTRCRNIK